MLECSNNLSKINKACMDQGSLNPLIMKTLSYFINSDKLSVFHYSEPEIPG